MTSFILNNQTVLANQRAGSTVLDYIRYHKRLTGTKIGCREGDCGACTVLAGGVEGNNFVYRSMTSCLMPLGNAQGKHIVTVEGINMKALSTVQQAMVDTNGTQCGFCTPGFVMSFTGFVLDPKNKSCKEAVAAVDGNICRCTGYKSIERSAKIISEAMALKPEANTTEWLVNHHFLPGYFLHIEQRLRELKTEKAMSKNGMAKTNMLIAGGTDLLVQKPFTVKTSSAGLLAGRDALKGIKAEQGQCYVGGGVTVSEFLGSAIIKTAFPDLEEHIKLVSSTPIRNMATMAGNICNASPIGDMTVFFLALDADLILETNEVQRTIKLKDFFQGYKLTARAPDEVLTRIGFALPDDKTQFNFEKVSKRTNLDIASVNTACQLKMKADGTIDFIHLSAGGVAPFPKYLSRTCTYLNGKKSEIATLQEALTIVSEEIAPISDARGSSDYKRFLLRQLIIAHLLKFFGPADTIKQLLFQ